MQHNIWAAIPVSLDNDRKADEVRVDKSKLKLDEKLARALKPLDENHDFFAKPTKKSKKHKLQNIYVDPADYEETVAELEKGGALILGAWDWDGNALIKAHAELADYMPVIDIIDSDENSPTFGQKIGEESGIREMIIVLGQNQNGTRERDFT